VLSRRHLTDLFAAAAVNSKPRFERRSPIAVDPEPHLPEV
jgi:hypothetical protein